MLREVRSRAAQGAQIDARDAAGRTSFRLAATAGSFRNVGDGSLILFLADHGGDINVKDDAGFTPLSWAEDRSRYMPIYKKVAEVLRQLGDVE